MALAHVLLGLALLTAVAVSLLSVSDTSYRLARNVLEVAQADATAEAAINRAVLALLDPQVHRRWRVDGIDREFSFEGIKVRVSIQDELGRIDLNHADGPLLARLFQSAGLDFQAAGRLVDKVLDWRDSSVLKRLHGAKAQDYGAAGLPYRPRNGPFQSVDELKLVMDMTPELFKRVEPALTVHSGRQFIDPQFAPREALLALPTMTADVVASMISARTGQTSGRPAIPPGIIDPAIPLRGRAFTIRAEVEKSNGVLTREAAIRITDDPLQPYWVLSWRNK